jgi:hypothetical protein
MAGASSRCFGEDAPENLSGWRRGVKQRMRTGDAHGLKANEPPVARRLV